MGGSKRYIFTFKEGTGENSPQAQKAKAFIKSQGGSIIHDYGDVGFAAEVPDDCHASVANFASNDFLSDAVEAVEEDGVVTTQ